MGTGAETGSTDSAQGSLYFDLLAKENVDVAQVSVKAREHIVVEDN